MIAILLSALVPLIIGFIWYNEKVFGAAWMRECGFSKEQLQGANMLKIFSFTLLFGLLLAFCLMQLTVHQGAVESLIGSAKYDTEENRAIIKPVLEAFKNNFRTFKHGCLHGSLSGLFLSLAFVGINGLFERRSWKYIFIHVGYWTLTCMLMCGIISAWA